MNDLISRESAYKEICRWRGYLDDDMIERIKMGICRIPVADAKSVEYCENCREEANRAISSALLFGKPTWIRVEDRLPDLPGEYLVFIKVPKDGTFYYDLSYVTSAMFIKDEGIWWVGADSCYNACLAAVEIERVAHVACWMPMPEKPEEVVE